MFGKRYFCNHTMYRDCTLFNMGNKGLAVIQQRDVIFKFAIFAKYIMKD